MAYTITQLILNDLKQNQEHPVNINDIYFREYIVCFVQKDVLPVTEISNYLYTNLLFACKRGYICPYETLFHLVYQH